MSEVTNEFEIDFDNTGQAQPENQSAVPEGEKPTPQAIDPNALAEAIAMAMVKAQSMQRTEPREPERDPSEVELENLKQRLAEVDKAISDLTMSNPESPQLGQLILERESIKSRIGDLEATLPLKKKLSEVEQRMQLAQSVPFQIDKLVASAEPLLARFGDKAAEMRAKLRIELAGAAQHDPSALFNEEYMNRIIRAWIGEQAMTMGLFQAPYDPGTAGGAPPPSNETEFEEQRWRKALEAIGLNPDAVLGGENA